MGKKHEYDLMVGIPCSRLPHESDIPCTREDEVMAMAFGAWLAGKQVKIFMQMSGFINCLDVITSLFMPYTDTDVAIMTVDNVPEPEHHLYAATLCPGLLQLLVKTNDAVKRNLGDIK